LKIDYNLLIAQHKQQLTTISSGKIVARYSTLSGPLDQTNPTEFRLVVTALV